MPQTKHSRGSKMHGLRPIWWITVHVLTLITCCTITVEAQSQTIVAVKACLDWPKDKNRCWIFFYKPLSPTPMPAQGKKWLVRMEAEWASNSTPNDRRIYIIDVNKITGASTQANIPTGTPQRILPPPGRSRLSATWKAAGQTCVSQLWSSDNEYWVDVHIP
jgi:hypothetical protein